MPELRYSAVTLASLNTWLAVKRPQAQRRVVFREVWAVAPESVIHLLVGRNRKQVEQGT